MDKLLTPEQLFETSKVNRKLPKVGSKEFDKTGNWLEDRHINFALQTRKKLLQLERVEKSNLLINAYWDTCTKKAIVTKNVGKHLQTFGHTLEGVTYLYPEEALYLVESKCLELSYGGIAMSLERCYEILSKESVNKLNGYRVYSHLSLYGYKVFRCNENDENKIPSQQCVYYTDLLMTRLSIMLRQVFEKVVPFNANLYINDTLIQHARESSLTSLDNCYISSSWNVPRRGFARTRRVNRLCPLFLKQDRLQSIKRNETFDENIEKYVNESGSPDLSRSEQNEMSGSYVSSSSEVEEINLAEDDVLVVSHSIFVIDDLSPSANGHENEEAQSEVIEVSLLSSSEESGDSDVQIICEKRSSDLEQSSSESDSGSWRYVTSDEDEAGSEDSNSREESFTHSSSSLSQTLITVPNSGHLTYTTDLSHLGRTFSNSKSSGTKSDNLKIPKNATKRHQSFIDLSNDETKKRRENNEKSKVEKEELAKSSKIKIVINKDYKLELKYEQIEKERDFIIECRNVIDNYNNVMSLLENACCEYKIDEILKNAENEILENCDLCADIKNWAIQNSNTKSYENTPVTPMIKCRGCPITGSTLARLKLFNTTNYSELESDLKPSFDVHFPSSDYTKTCKPVPNYKVIVLGPTDALPSLTEVELIRKQYNTPILLAVVYPDSISFLRSVYVDLNVP